MLERNLTGNHNLERQIRGLKEIGHKNLLEIEDNRLIMHISRMNLKLVVMVS